MIQILKFRHRWLTYIHRTRTELYNSSHLQHMSTSRTKYQHFHIMNRILLSSFCFAIAYTLVQADVCDYDGETCQKDTKELQWTCPDGGSPDVRAFWGRDLGDITTCTDKAPRHYFKDQNCAGSDEMARKAVTDWCNANVKGNGSCSLQASRRSMGYDPCPNTWKYLRVCTFCKSELPISVSFTSYFGMRWHYSYENEETYNELISNLKRQFDSRFKNTAGFISVEHVRVWQFHHPDYLYINVTASVMEEIWVKVISELAQSLLHEPFHAAGQEVVANEGFLVTESNQEYIYVSVCSLYNEAGACKHEGECVATSGKPECSCRHPYVGEFCNESTVTDGTE